MPVADRPTRKYTRLSDDDWQKACDDWASGETTLAEIADRTGASVRNLQIRFAAEGIIKGETARATSNQAALAAMASLPMHEDVDPKAAVLEGARRIETAIIGQLAIVEADPTQGHRVGSVLKSLDAAATALSRVYDLKSRLLGLDKIENEDLPVLEVRVLTEQDVQEIRRQQEEEDDDFELADDSENGVINLS